MCIRDRWSCLHLRTSSKIPLLPNSIFFRAAICLFTWSRNYSCLLYTSDAAERIERCPSRGLGDVYKRQMVVFAPQNVIKDPPFTKLDILSCRNMLIYMEPELQRKLITLFNYSLNPGGIMLLGTAETLGNNSLGFEELNSRLRIFKRTVTSQPPELTDFPSSFYHKKIAVFENSSTPVVVENLQSLADQILLQRFAPASVMVNRKAISSTL